MTDHQMNTRARVERSMVRRRRAEMRFRAYGILSIGFGLLCLVVLFGNILSKGLSTFSQTVLEVNIHIDKDYLEISRQSTDDEISNADYEGLIKTYLREQVGAESRADRRDVANLVSVGAHWQIRDAVAANHDLIGDHLRIKLIMDDDVDQWFKHDRDRGMPGRLNEKQIAWLDKWAESGALSTRFNSIFFVNGDSREPELAGIRGAMAGSLLTMLVTFLLSFPIGVAAAIYLEEFAPRNRMTDIVEININNLAAVPSITFGLLGLAIFIGFFGVARSTPLIGGLVLTLMTLPTIIISGRAAIKSVPPSIREAALGLGASRLQTVFHHVLPLAMPGMLTGTIIGMAQALGETAPLLMIGMIAFVVDVPSFINDPSTVLPVQIFLWSDSPERAFTERTSGAIIVLLVFLIVMNTAAVWLRRRLERRW
jgi:phosphate transport system permease protein